MQSGEEELLSKIESNSETKPKNSLRQPHNALQQTVATTGKTSSPLLTTGAGAAAGQAVRDSRGVVTRRTASTTATASDSESRKRRASIIRLSDWLEQRARNVRPLNETSFYSYGQFFGLPQAALRAPIDFAARFLTPGEVLICLGPHRFLF